MLTASGPACGGGGLWLVCMRVVEGFRGCGGLVTTVVQSCGQHIPPQPPATLNDPKNPPPATASKYFYAPPPFSTTVTDLRQPWAIISNLPHPHPSQTFHALYLQ